MRNYGEFVDAHEWKFRWLLRAQRMLPRLPARVQRGLIRAAGRKRFLDWAFGHYLRIAPPSYAWERAPRPSRDEPSRLRAAA
jgi:digeranylgeranylglycerophospholipid reductase